MTATKWQSARLPVLLQEYFSNTTLHGLRFITESNRHWTERVFWVVCCLLSWYCSALLILASWDAFQNHAISFVVETTYLDANTSFPSITVCEEDNMDRVFEKANQVFGMNHDNNLDEVLKEIVFFRGTAYFIKEFCFTGDIRCPKGNYKDIAAQVRSGCKEVFNYCKWRDKPFNCCQHFFSKSTELGICFTLSSSTENPESPDYINTMSNVKIGPASLYLETKVNAKVYMHSEMDIPYYNSMTTETFTAEPNSWLTYAISIRDIENQREVRELSIKQRQCRFADENYLTVSEVYSYSACGVECRKKHQLKLCNCTSHLMPRARQDQMCDMKGLVCLFEHYNELATQKAKSSSGEGHICDCLPSCNEPEYNLITVTPKRVAANQSITEIVLDRIPSERYKRNVVRGRLDLLVSMGGAAGLFVGASLLSFAEFIYYLTLRPCTMKHVQLRRAEPKTKCDLIMVQTAAWLYANKQVLSRPVVKRPIRRYVEISDQCSETGPSRF